MLSHNENTFFFVFSMVRWLRVWALLFPWMRIFGLRLSHCPHISWRILFFFFGFISPHHMDILDHLFCLCALAAVTTCLIIIILAYYLRSISLQQLMWFLFIFCTGWHGKWALGFRNGFSGTIEDCLQLFQFLFFLYSRLMSAVNIWWNDHVADSSTLDQCHFSSIDTGSSSKAMFYFWSCCSDRYCLVH